MKPGTGLVLSAVLLGGFFLAGCEVTKPYTDAAKGVIKPVTDAAKSVLENVDIQPTPEQAPEDDRG